MKPLIRPLAFGDMAVFERTWTDFILSETSEEDRFLYPVRFFRPGFFLKKLFNSDSFWDNFLVYEADNKMAGFMEVLPHPRKKGEVFVKNFVILPSLRGRGYGRVFLDGIIEKYSDGSINKLSLEVRENNPAVNFYKKTGFKVIDKRISMRLILKESEESMPLPGFRPGENKDRETLNNMMKICDEKGLSPGFNLVPYFPENFNVKKASKRWKKENFDLYVLDPEGRIEAYGVVYSYLEFGTALLEIIHMPDVSSDLLRSFLGSIIEKVKGCVKLLFSFTGREEILKSAFESAGGTVYRADTIMEREV